MSSSIDNGDGDVSQVYQQQLTGIDDASQVFADGRAAELQSDTIAQSPQIDKQIKQLSEDSSSPQLFPSDQEEAEASEGQVKDLQQMIKNLAGGDIQAFLQGLPPEVQQAIQEGNPQAQMLLGNVQGQKQLDALASLGLETVPDLSNLKLNNIVFPGPGPIDSTQSIVDQQAQLMTNQVDSTGKAFKMMGAEAAALPPGTPGGDSLAAFLASISDAISKLQQYLGTVQQADLKGNLGQAKDAGGDRGQLAKAEADKQKDDSGGLFGGLKDMFSGIPIIGDLAKLGTGADMLGGLGDMFGGSMDMDVPILGDLLKGLASTTSGIPLIGDMTKMLGDNPMLAVVGVITFVAVTAMLICTGPLAPILGASAALMVMGGMGMMSGKGGMGDMFKDIPILGDLLGGLGGGKSSSSTSSEGDEDGGMLGGLMGGGDGLLGGLLPKEIPLVGDMFSGLTDTFSGIPIIGGVFQWAGENQGAALLTVALCVVLFPIAPIMFPVVLIGMMQLTGGMDKVPIMGDLFGGDMLGGIMGGGSSDDKKTQEGSSDDKKAQQAGTSNAVADAYGSTAQRLAEENGATEENAQIVGQLQKLIAMLIAIKAAVAGGGAPNIPTDQMLSVIQNLSAQGIGGSSFQQAIAAGQSGDSAGMVAALSQGFADAGSDPEAIAGAINAGGQQVKSGSDLSGNGFEDTIISLIPA